MLKQVRDDGASSPYITKVVAALKFIDVPFAERPSLAVSVYIWDCAVAVYFCLVTAVIALAGS